MLNLKPTSYSSCSRGEKELNVLAVENDIQPNLLRNWKKEFLANASLAFDNKREDNLREKLAEERKEKAEYAKKVGQLTMQVDWLKKNLKKLSDLTTRVNLVRNLSTTKELPVSTGAKLLGINRTSVYYGGIPVSEEELECKAVIDHLHTDNPTWGARQMSAQLKLRGYQVGRRNAVIDRPNQAWSIDITYIPMKHGFLYLTAIIDWYSRCIVGWDVDDTLDTTMVINACKKAFKVAKPLIINSDQGSQFTSDKYIEFIRDNGIRQSMDGKSRWADNIMIERWFRSFKYEEAYLTEYANLKGAREAIGRYIYTYNFERCHQSIGNKRPAEVYYPAMLLDAARAAA